MKNFLIGLGAWLLVILIFTGVILAPMIALCIKAFDAIVAGSWGLAALIICVIGLIFWIFVMDWKESKAEEPGPNLQNSVRGSLADRSCCE